MRATQNTTKFNFLNSTKMSHFRGKKISLKSKAAYLQNFLKYDVTKVSANIRPRRGKEFARTIKYLTQV